MNEKKKHYTIETLPPLFDESVLAEALGKSTKWAQQARLRGTGPKFKKLDGSIRYTREDVHVWITESTRQSTSDTPALGNAGRSIVRGRERL